VRVTAVTVIAIRHADVGGDQIVIHNDDGSISGYAHTGSISGLSVGQHVNEGDIIGQSNGSGNVKPHLHYTRRECPSCPQNRSFRAPAITRRRAKPCGPGGKCSKMMKIYGTFQTDSFWGDSGKRSLHLFVSCCFRQSATSREV